MNLGVHLGNYKANYCFTTEIIEYVRNEYILNLYSLKCFCNFQEFYYPLSNKTLNIVIKNVSNY